MNRSFKDIIAWQKAYSLVLDVYRVTNKFPASEKFGLCSQFQRAAVSVIANIAEGYKKISKADKLRIMNIAQGSLEECKCYIILSKDLGYIDESEHRSLGLKSEEASKVLNAYCKAILNTSYVNEL